MKRFTCVYVGICVYWPVLLCNGRIDPEVLRVSYWRRENARCSPRKKQKPGGMDSASTVLCTWQDVSCIYVIHQALCITYYERGNDALPPALLNHSSPHCPTEVLDTSRLQWFWTLHALLPRSPNSISSSDEEISYNIVKNNNKKKKNKLLSNIYNFFFCHYYLHSCIYYTCIYIYTSKSNVRILDKILFTILNKIITMI